MVAGLLALLIGSVAISQLWPKGRSLIANGPTVPASGSGPATVSPTPAGATEPSIPPPTTPDVQPTPSPELEPTVPPLTPLPGLPVAVWSAEVERRIAIPEAFEAAVPMAVWGPRTYLLDADGRLLVVDLQAGTSRTVVLPLLPAEGSGSIAVDGDVMAVVTGRQKGIPGPQGGLCVGSDEPIDWRVLAAHLGSDGLPADPFESVAQGTARRDFTYPVGPPCGGPWAPEVAVGGNEVFVGQEAATKARPWASTIGVVDLAAIGASPREAGSLAVSGVVVSLSAAPGLTVWVATTGAPPGQDGDQPTPTWSLGYALDGSTVASTVEAAGPGQGWLPLPSTAADDGIIWWSVVPGYPGLGQINPGALEETFVAGDAPGATVPAGGLSGLDCKLLGASLGRALASCRDPADPTGGDFVPVVAGGGQAFQIVDGSAVAPLLGHGWMVWLDLEDGSPGTDILTGLPLTAVGGGSGP